MRTLSKYLAASAGVLALAAAGAASATVVISFDGATAVAGGTFADGGYTFVADCGVVNCGGFAAITVSGATGALPTLLHSATVDATNAAGAAADINIWVTRTDISSPDYDLFGSSFTSNNTPLFGPTTPFSVTMTTFVSSTNALFGGSPLSTFSSSATGSSSSNQVASGVTGGGLYSISEEYTIHANAFGITESTSPTIIVEGVAVPEPATWGLMIMGFGGVGALLRNRRRQVTFA